MIWTMTARERRPPRPLVVRLLLALELVVDLARALGEQEQAAEQQDQIAARDAALPRTVNSGSRQARQPGEREQQQRCA